MSSEKPPWSQAGWLFLPLLSQASAGFQASCPKDRGCGGSRPEVTNEPVTRQLPIPVPTHQGHPSAGAGPPSSLNPAGLGTVLSAGSGAASQS